MKLESKLKNLTNKIDKIEDKINDLGMKALTLRKERSNLFSKLIFENKLLDKTEWDLTINSKIGTLELSKDGTFNFTQKVEEFMRIEYESILELEDGIQLRHGDGIFLHFAENKQILYFIKKHNLIVDGGLVLGKLTSMRKELTALENICHQFGTIL